MIRKDGSLAELSQLSLVAALAGTRYGDNRFYSQKKCWEGLMDFSVSR